MSLDECKQYALDNGLNFISLRGHRSTTQCIPRPLPIGCLIRKHNTQNNKGEVMYNYNNKQFKNGICKSKFTIRGVISDHNHNKTLNEILNNAQNCGIVGGKHNYSCVNSPYEIQKYGKKNSIMTLDDCKKYATDNNLTFSDSLQNRKEY